MSPKPKSKSARTAPPSKAPSARRKVAPVKKDPEEQWEEPLMEDEDWDITAVADPHDDDDDEEDWDGAIADDDDFEVKAEKYRRRMLQQQQLADDEQRDDVGTRTSRATVLRDAEEQAAEEEGAAGSGGERAQLLERTHSAEELRDRIAETLRVLARFSEEREEDRARAEYLALLRADLLELYEYNAFLMDEVLQLFPPAEAVDFLEAMEKTRPTTVRVNTLKAKRRDLVQALVKRGMNIEPLERWSTVGLQVFESNVPLSGTIEYLAGHYMLQAAASFLPVMALEPLEGERVLDLSAAPGGKTTHIAQLMKNTGVLFANDVSEPRCKSLNANLQRLGVTNAIVTNYDGTGYAKVMRNFDRVLLDAPCTGTGIISRDKSIKTSKHLEDVQRATQLQRQLLLSAIDACRVGGCIVYSTCSFLVEENEAIVDFAVRRRDVEVVDMGLPFGRPGLTKFRHHRYVDGLKHARRYFPHVHNMDGFFVCRLEKRGADALAPTTAPKASSDAPARSRGDKKAGAAPLAKASSPGEPYSGARPNVSVPPSRRRPVAAPTQGTPPKKSAAKPAAKQAVKRARTPSAAPSTSTAGKESASAAAGKATPARKRTKKD